MKWRVLSLFSATILLFCGSSVDALGVVISSVRTGESNNTALGINNGASREYASIYNNTSDPIDVTNWCIQYASASDVTKTKLACIKPPDSQTKLILKPAGYVNFASNEFVGSVSGFVPDFVFSPGMSGTSGHLRLLDASGVEIDKIGWGSTVSPETSPVPTHQSGHVLIRKTLPNNLLQDTNNNLNDFTDALLSVIPASGLEEEVVPVDVCLNIDGLQSDLPDDYMKDESGDCQQDICDNLDGLQTSVPETYESLDGANCTPKVITLESSILSITELLPNVSGDDTGKEYVEIYNPNNYAVDLKGYRLGLNSSSPKTYTFASSQLLNALSFISFNDIFTKMTLPNSSASLSLTAPAGNLVDQTEAYVNPADDEAWALINSTWQFTNQPTNASANKSSLASEVTDDTEIQPCPEGKYRNPDTGRCRNIVTLMSELIPCAEGQVRNPTTNRCRSATATSNLVPCKPGQERNPETNRCRSITTASASLVPCKEGEERNPETNRCRKVDTAVKGVATSQVKDVPSKIASPSNLIVYGVLGVLILVYAVREWRPEIARAISRFKR